MRVVLHRLQQRQYLCVNAIHVCQRGQRIKAHKRLCVLQRSQQILAGTCGGLAPNRQCTRRIVAHPVARIHKCAANRGQRAERWQPDIAQGIGSRGAHPIIRMRQRIHERVNRMPARGRQGRGHALAQIPIAAEQHIHQRGHSAVAQSPQRVSRVEHHAGIRTVQIADRIIDGNRRVIAPFSGRFTAQPTPHKIPRERMLQQHIGGMRGFESMPEHLKTRRKRPTRRGRLFCALKQKLHHISVAVTDVVGHPMPQIKMHEQHIPRFCHRKAKLVLRRIVRLRAVVLRSGNHSGRPHR